MIFIYLVVSIHSKTTEIFLEHLRNMERVRMMLLAQLVHHQPTQNSNQLLRLLSGKHLATQMLLLKNLQMN